MMILILAIILVIGGIFCLNANKDKKEVINTSLSVKSFNKIKIDSSNSEVKFHESNRYGVIYHGKKGRKPSISVEHGTLKIESPRKNIEINADIFNWKYQTPMLTVEMPKKELDNLSIDLSNGSVHANYLRVKTGNIDTSNGNINIKKLITQKDFDIDTSNGNVLIKKCNSSGYDLDTSNGQIRYQNKNKDDSFVKNKSSINVLSVDTSNGNITVN